MRKPRRRLGTFPKLRLILVLLSCLAAAEIASFLILKASGMAMRSGSYTAYYENHLKHGLDLAWFSPLVPHPYFGFQHDKTANPRVNNHGFLSPIDYPYRKKPDEFVIGILGGSVAEQLALHLIQNQSFSSLATRVPRLRGKKIVVLNLCLPAGRQPQQFFIAAYFMQMLDLLVNVDGVWETITADRRYPADFPQAYHYLYGPGTIGFLERGWVSALRGADHLLTRLPLKFSPFSMSSSYCLLWQLAGRASAGAASWATNRGGARAESAHPFRPSVARSDEENAAEVLENWTRYSMAEHTVAASEGRHAVFMIRPTALFKETGIDPGDPFFLHGLGLFIRNLHPPLEKRFESLRGQARALRKKGLQVFDLSDSFAGMQEQVYVDSVDHLNETGKRIFSERMLETLVRYFTSSR